MSVDIEVIFKRSDLPAFSAWQNEIANIEIPIKLTEVGLETHSGYLPATLSGEDTGFEFDLNSFDSSEYPDSFRDKLVENDSVASFRFAEESECITALACASAFGRLANGLIIDTTENAFLDHDEALGEAKSAWEIFLKKKREKEKQGRTPAKWRKRFLEICQTINPAYENNKLVKGRFMECIRKDESGLFVSQNCIHISGTYYHCFALLFTLKDIGPALYNPFLAGGRFDHNFEIWRGFDIDMGFSRSDPNRPKSLNSSHMWRKGSEEMIEKCLRNAEEYLLPFYRSKLATGSEMLSALFSTAQNILSKLDLDNIDISRCPEQENIVKVMADQIYFEGDVFYSWEEYQRRQCTIFALAQNTGMNAEQALINRQYYLNLKALDIVSPKNELNSIPVQERNEGIVLNNIDEFFAVKENLPRLIEFCHNLKQYDKTKGILNSVKSLFKK